VPVRLQAAVARVLAQGKDRQSFLKKSLGTKDLKAANIRAKPVQAGFDRVFGEAEQLLAARPMRETLSATEIKRMAEALYGRLLSNDEAWRFGGRAFMVQAAAQLRRDGVEPTPHSPLHTLPEFGWSPEQLSEQRDNLASELQTMQEALARGDIRERVTEPYVVRGAFHILANARPSPRVYWHPRFLRHLGKLLGVAA
jgi:hypothetical protein